MKDRQVVVWHSVTIQQDVFRTAAPGVSENNLEVPRDVDDGIFGCIDKLTVSGSASGQLARDAMTGIAVRNPVDCDHGFRWIVIMQSS